MSNEYLTVTALTNYIKRKFDYDPYLKRIYLTGEISNWKNRSNAHRYFSIKDEFTKISAVMFQSAAQKLKFEPEEGMKVLVIGQVSVYPKTGTYQIVIEHMEPDGIGALYQALEETKKKLKNEGLFNAPKKLIPIFPKRIAIITSPAGAVIRDIITTVKRRYPIVQLVIFPTLVQGDKAADDIVESIRKVEEKGDFDTMILARGGGSIEDLWPFNEEKVARAIFDAATPVISSVGHETDTTIADLAADVRAATPTAAAELSVPLMSEEILKIEQLRLRLIQSYSRKIEVLTQRLERSLGSYIFKQPQRLYESYMQNLDLVMERLIRSLDGKVNREKQEFRLLQFKLMASNPKQVVKQKQTDLDETVRQLAVSMSRYMEKQDQRLEHVTRSLDYLSPLKIMNRGYSYVTKDGKVVKETDSIQQGDLVKIHLHKGSLEAKITKKAEGSE